MNALTLLIAVLVGAAAGAVVAALVAAGRRRDDQDAVDQALADLVELADRSAAPDVRRRARELAQLIVLRLRPADYVLPEPSPLPLVRWAPGGDGEQTVPLPAEPGQLVHPGEPSLAGNVERARARDARFDAAVAEAWDYIRSGFGRPMPDGVDGVDFRVEDVNAELAVRASAGRGCPSCGGPLLAAVDAAPDPADSSVVVACPRCKTAEVAIHGGR